MHRIYWGAPLVQETCFWCTKWTKRCRWYRKRASGVPNGIRDVLVQEKRFWCTNKDKTYGFGYGKKTVGDIHSSTLVRGIVGSDPNNYYSG